MGDTGQKPLDKRIEASRDKVLRETYRILSAQGFAGASIDAVAKHSGVAKTTIYRHWPSRADLLLDACARIGKPVEAPNTGDLRRDLTLLLNHLLCSRSCIPIPLPPTARCWFARSSGAT